jgi:hypothetical protein
VESVLTLTIYKARTVIKCEGCGKSAAVCHLVKNERFDSVDKLCAICVDYQVQVAKAAGDTVVDERGM